MVEVIIVIAKPANPIPATEAAMLASLTTRVSTKAAKAAGIPAMMIT